MDADVLNIGVRFLLYIELAVLFGVPLFAGWLLRSTDNVAVLESWRPTLRFIAWAAIVTAALGLSVMAVQMAGAWNAAWNRKMLLAVIGTPYGQAWLFRIAALFGVAVLLLWPLRRAPERAIAISLAGIALGSLAWGGHALALQGPARAVHLTADVLHLLAAGAWIGAIVALRGMVASAAKSRDGDDIRVAARALGGFATDGTVIVATVILSGSINGWMIVGFEGAAAAIETPYGVLLLAKLFLFSVMLWLAALNRFRLVPKLETALNEGQRDQALGHLKRSLMLEYCLALGVLALVAVLGTLGPLPE